MHPAAMLRGLANNVLHLVLLPTEACNFRCTYCYEEFRYARMHPRVVQGVQRFLSRRAPALASLEISWFGGEPLLAADIVEAVSRHALELVAAHPRLRYRAGISTNGWLLTPQRFRRLLALGIDHYQISFDGPREWHDRKRVRAGGRGTFDRLWTHALAMRAEPRPFQATVRLHVDPENHAALPDFIRQYADAFGGDQRFRLFIRRVACLGRPYDATRPVFDAASGDAVSRALARHAAALGVASVTIDQHPPVCYAARGNSYVVRADGRLNKCTVALEHPCNQVGRMTADGLLEIDNAKMNQWMRGLWSGDARACACPMHGDADPNSLPTSAAPPAQSPRPPARSPAPVVLVLPQTPA